MEFTYSEYQNTKKQILDQFYRCQDYYDTQKNDSLFDINQYRKLIDQVKTKKSFTNNKLNKIKIKNKACSHSKTILMDQSRLTYSNKKSIMNDSQKKVDDSQFFLTNLMPNINQNISKQQSMTKTQKLLSQFQIKRLSTQDDQLEKHQIQVINNQIFYHQCSKKNLQNQINELQNAIIYLKKKFNYLQKEDITFQLRKTQVQEMFHQNKISLINFKRKNHISINNFAKTSRAFQLSLQGRKKNQTITNRQNQNTLDDVTQKLIKIDKFKSRIKKQNEQIKFLDKQNRQLIQKSRSFNLLVNHYKQVFIINDLINRIKNKQFVNFYERLDLYNEISDQQFRQKTLKNNLEKITNTILEFFSKKKDQQLKMYSLFVIKSDEKKQLSQTFQKLINFQNFTEEQRLVSFLEDIKINEKHTNSPQQECVINLIDRKVKHLADNLVSLEERMKFFIQRQYKSLKIIQQIWLKFDKSAANFVQELSKQLINQFSNSSQSLSQSQSKNCFINYFQKWDRYSFFLEVINKNPFIYRFLTKQLLTEYLRKIVKTKMKQSEIDTSKLFLLCLDQIQNDALNLCRQNIIKLISIYEKINKYASKFQVLIVNSKNQDEKQKQEQKQNQIVTMKSLKNIESQKSKSQNVTMLTMGMCNQIGANQIHRKIKNNNKIKRMISNKSNSQRSNIYDDNIQSDLHNTLSGQWSRVNKIQLK